MLSSRRPDRQVLTYPLNRINPILIIMYQILSNAQPYQELGGSYFDELERERVERRLVRRLQRLGYRVSLQAASVLTG